jgi:hypothetical protein
MTTMVLTLVAGVMLVLYLARRRHRLGREAEAD